jgi:hypothetical protein
LLILASRSKRRLGSPVLGRELTSVAVAKHIDLIPLFTFISRENMTVFARLTQKPPSLLTFFLRKKFKLEGLPR